MALDVARSELKSEDADVLEQIRTTMLLERADRLGELKKAHLEEKRLKMEQLK